MAKPEQCKNCNKPATIHLTQIINNKIHKVDLCEDCPYKESVTNPEGFSLADFLAQPPVALSGKEDLQCEACGFTPADFKKSGRFGCPECYRTFYSIVEPMLANMHKDTVHRGKVPRRAIARMSRKRHITDLEKGLHEAVEVENYEEAARLRDQIAEAKAALAATVGEES